MDLISLLSYSTLFVCVIGHRWEFGKCSETCGTGQKVNKCIYEAPAVSSTTNTCTFPSTVKIACNTQLCVWEEWEAWTRCSGECEQSGVRDRKRKCDKYHQTGKPSIKCGGAPASQEQPCRSPECARNLLSDLTGGGAFNAEKFFQTIMGFIQGLSAPGQIGNILGKLNLGDIVQSRSKEEKKYAVKLTKAELKNNVDDVIELAIRKMTPADKTSFNKLPLWKQRVIMNKIIDQAL